MSMTSQTHALHGYLRRFGVDALLLNTSETLSSANLRYFTGFTGSDASLLVTKTQRLLFTDGRYKTQAKQQAKGFDVLVVRRKLDALARALKNSGIQRLGVESSRISLEFVNALGKRIPQVKIVPLRRSFLEALRMSKTVEERDMIKTAAHIASEVCRTVVEAGLRGKPEKEIAAHIEHGFRTRGAEAVAFPTIVASGERSALPHAAASDKVIAEGDLVIVDFGCRFDGYHSDETVTCRIGGTPSSEQKRIHAAVYDAHMRALEIAAVGRKVREVDRAARESLDKSGYGKYFMHGLGHGVGLEIHEPPSLSPRGSGVLVQGAVFTIEPGVYLEGFGGVRLESLVYLSNDGPEILSEMPKSLLPVD
ncbi:MAG: Xaa-Pro peptidase family protein [Thermodesulfobacteriota bacterium]